MIIAVKMTNRLNEIEKEVSEAEKGREESEERLKLLERLEEEKEKRDKMLVRLKDFAENDPAVLEQMVKETGEAVEAVNRWTDNIFSIQGWIKKKFPSVDQVDCRMFKRQKLEECFHFSGDFQQAVRHSRGS